MSTLTEAAENIAREELARLGECPSSVDYLIRNGMVAVVPAPKPEPLEKL